MRVRRFGFGVWAGLVCGAAAVCGAPASPGLSLTVANRLVRETVLVRDGRACAEILHPDTPSGRAAAAALAAAVKERTGTALPCRTGTAADREPKQTVIMLGHVGNNPALLPLYGRFQTLADPICPGPGGALAQTVSDPFGNGADVIVAGASDEDGLAASAGLVADALRARPAGPTLALPRLFQARYGEAFRKRYAQAVRAPKAAHVKEGLKAAAQTVREGRHCSVARLLEDAGSRYLISGHAAEARLYVALWDFYERSAVADARAYGGPWGFDSDFPSARVVAAWDLIEHDPSLTDDDRLRVARHMGRWLKEAVIPKCAGAVKRNKVLFNHETFPALGALFAGLYYTKSYPVSEGPAWLAMADAIFRRQSGYAKSHEDCNSYQWLTHGHLMRYAVARPDLTFIENGNAGAIAAYAVGSMDNLGYQVPYGDTGNWRCTFAESFFLSAYAFLAGDADACWVRDLKLRVFERPPVFWTSCFMPAESADGRAAPTRFNGVRAWPLDKHYYASFPEKPQPPLARCVDKVSFRAALDPQAPYLLLDGLSNGGHGHRDGNSVSRLTQFGRVWLADNDYFKKAVKYHNTLLVIRDGGSAPIPAYCELLGSGETPRYGFSRTRLKGYAGVDWDRTVVWLKDLQAFAVLDRVVAKQKGRYQFRTLWHGIGEARLEDDGLLLSQKGPSLRIQLAPGTAVALKNDAELGEGNWSGYPYADPVVRSLSAVSTVELEAGEPHLVATVLYGALTNAPAKWSLATLADRSGAVVRPARGGEIGIALGPFAQWPSGAALQSDAQVIVTDGAGVTLLGGTRTALDGQPLHAAAQPACADLAPAPDALMPRRLPPAAAACAPESSASGVRPHREVWGKALAEFHPSTNAALKTLHATRLASARLVPAAPVRQVLAATREGVLIALNAEGARLWSVELGTPLNDVTAADLDRDGCDEIVVARQDGHVAVLDAGGHERWRRKLDFYRKQPYVNLVRTGDLNGDGLPEVIAGGNNWRFYAYKADGTPLWNYESVHPSRSGAVADLDGDGKAEVVCGTHYYNLTALRGDGSRLWAHKHGPIAYAVATGSFDGDRRRRVLLGSGDGCVYVLGPAGKELLQYDTGDEVRQVLATDVDGDGRDEVLAGSLSHAVYCFGADGGRRWTADLGAGLSALAAAPVASSGSVVWAGTVDGQVVTLDVNGARLARTARTAGVAELLADGASSAWAATEDGRLCRLTLR